MGKTTRRFGNKAPLEYYGGIPTIAARACGLMKPTIEQFGKALTADGLMSTTDLKAFWEKLPADERPKDGEGLATKLTAAGKLTPFQVGELLAGRGRSLVMGEYVIHAEIGAGGMGKVYKAKHRRMERIVAL